MVIVVVVVVEEEEEREAFGDIIGGFKRSK